ncbi:hypothetical protein P343_16025 [Sporolactobacillus laevolacticus DSM 442]|uniref:Uncharacterized protein n=1 Tax=Sporolactobacillus laevolacticus DSM 442 TaxID=1395513 RepID=V6IUI5_9BACL|nr:hypothetical protein P343_16025 [Sporolactobacillus laevolacticus DSM 442]
MNWKLYGLLTIPALIIMTVLVVVNQHLLFACVPIIFWIFYYSINFIQKRRRSKNQNNDY